MVETTQDRVDDGQYPFFVRSQTIERINSYSYDGEAVLTAGDGVGTGKVFHYINGRFDAHQRVYRISDFSHRINGYFFYLYFSTHFLNRIMQMTAKSSVDSVRRDMIAKMTIPLPPTVAEQEAIAAALEDIHSEILALEAKRDKACDIKQGMMQELLTGRDSIAMIDIGQPERITQNRIITLFRSELHYRYLGDWTDRPGNSNIEEDILSEWLKKCGYTPAQISTTLYKLHTEADNHSRTLYGNNKAVYNLLRYGVPVKTEAGKVTETVHLINWREPEENDFAIAEEVTLKGNLERRPDLVLYVNGIAIGVIELKNSRVSIGDGVRQLLSNQQPEFNEWFFSTVQIVFAGNDTEGLRYGTIKTEEKYFLTWKEDEADGELEHIHYFCGNTEIPSDLEDRAPLRTALYKATVAFLRAYSNVADELEEAGYSEAEGKEIKLELDRFLKLREIIRNASGENLDLKAYEADMRHLLDTYIEADEPRSISPFGDIPLLDLIVKTGIADAINTMPKSLKGNKEGIAETIENNVRSKIIKEHLNDPTYYDKMSALLDEIIAARKSKALEYEKYLQEIAELAKKVEKGHDEDIPKTINTPGRRALYNNLGKDEALALRIDEAVKTKRPHGWRGIQTRERVIKGIIDAIVDDEAEVERIFAIIRQHPEY